MFNSKNRNEFLSLFKPHNKLVKVLNGLRNLDQSVRLEVCFSFKVP